MKIKDLVVLLEVKPSYGHERIYPANQLATKICKLTGRKTFNPNDLETIESIGFIIQKTYIGAKL